MPQGYTKPREYIVTEWPIKHTPGDFWSLVYDYECSAVVVLCLPPRDSVSRWFSYYYTLYSRDRKSIAREKIFEVTKTVQLFIECLNGTQEIKKKQKFRNF